MCVGVEKHGGYITKTISTAYMHFSSFCNLFAYNSSVIFLSFFTMMSASSRKQVLQSISGLFPTIKTELIYQTEFQFLIAVILSAQATDVQVNKLTKELFALVSTPQDVLDLPEGKLLDLVKSINYFRHKADFIYRSAQMILAKFDGAVPQTLPDLQLLPGVGIKTAKVVASVLFDGAYVGVDTHIHRVANRIGWATTKTPEATDKVLEKLLSDDEKQKYRHSLVLFGRYVCLARKPKCETCPINQFCRFY